MSSIQAFYEARKYMVDALRADLIGSESDDVITEEPLNRFVTGILFPQEAPEEQAPERLDPDTDEAATNKLDEEDHPVSLSHVRRPSAFGLSFSVLERTARLRVVISAAQYTAATPEEGGDKEPAQTPQARKAWRRSVVSEVIDVTLTPGTNQDLPIADSLILNAVVRKAKDGALPITVAIINTAPAPRGKQDELCWYQVDVKIQCDDGFIDRPTSVAAGLTDEDVRSNRLLFRDARNLAVGHGCAVEWTDGDPVTELRMTFIPTHEVQRADTRVKGVDLPMSAFSRGEGFDQLHLLVQLYRSWIQEQKDRIPSLDTEDLCQTAQEHLARAQEAADRIEDGISLLDEDVVALRAFKLMNRAMYAQRNKQEFIRNGAAEQEQRWRPFQIAFILMNLRALTDPKDQSRDLADLLWFPTGGGKTEAYLGLIAYTILLRRLHNSQHGGVSVLMRYTLRLLTLQQFERAAGLICALETIRKQELPEAKEISLGIWVGQSSTPNNGADARTAINKLRRGESLEKGNPMQLTSCPWCGTQLTPDEYKVTGPEDGLRMSVTCPNSSCDFSSGLPVHIIDSDVYRERPSLVIGTVDKFAMLAWRAEAQTLFSSDGQHPKPDLIVQDELHLISGPLGTMVGLYETAIDAAATGDNGRPKLIASTATIRRASEQVGAVFAREAKQFPPPGLDSGNSFFSQDADAESTGTRQYVGVLAQGQSHTYLMVRTYAALLQAAQDLDAPDEVRDAFWTLMGYFNSLRVLGGAAIQATDDVPAHMGVIAKRTGTQPRSLGEPKELTSRIPSSEVPERLKELAIAKDGDAAPMDVVLATNMISVGLDVDRLGLMAVMGQPQATAEYIQATSRVGRTNPGLVVVIFNAMRSRDLSHYENFSTFHRALYRQVEPNSATPFSPRARDRGLHGCLVAYARTTQPSLNPDSGVDLPGADPSILEASVAGIIDRAKRVAPEQAEATERQLESLVEAWEDAAAGNLNRYAGWRGDTAGALLGEAVATLDSEGEPPLFPVSEAPWATLTSLRDVDAVSNLRIIADRKPRP